MHPFVLFLLAAAPVDITGVKPGPVQVQSTTEALTVRWPDETARMWTAEFSLDPARPLITSVKAGDKTIVDRARPLYWVATGKRRGGWDQFFDLPPSHPEGTRRSTGVFKLVSATARSAGDRVEVDFAGLDLGIFRGGIRYTFYPGTRLLHQEAIASTNEPDTAYYYDAGLRLTADADRRVGGNMESEVTWYDTDGHLRSGVSSGPERVPVAVRYRTLALRTAGGALAAFPAPHQYFFARDFTTNMGYVWHNSWRGGVSLGIRQLPDDNTSFYPWMNAPPGTRQRMGVFFQLSDGESSTALNEVLRYTNRDRFVSLDGYKTMSMHWHLAYSGQAVERGFDWVPPFKPVLKAMGVDANVIMDFHGDGHPRDLTPLRLKEMEDYWRACRTQSDGSFLLIPGEEANVHFGGHWAIIYPKPIYWFMARPEATSFMTQDPKYGTVYRAGNAQELLEMVKREGAIVYQTHPRTKGSTGFPDKIRETEHFRDATYLGAGWKAMPSDLSSFRLSERSFKLLDDMNNWGLRKRLVGEVDVFQIDSTHELYSHMNVNYVKLDRLPDWDNYNRALAPLVKGEYFVTTGEILLPEVAITPAAGDEVAVRARVQWTFPLAVAEVVWGDGTETNRKLFPLDTARQFGNAAFDWKVSAPRWKWARLAVFDIAGNGAFMNPVWR
jgi:hypothetical protein